jgi:hypothetical protein
MVVQPSPDAGVDDFAAEVIRRVEVPHRIQVAGRPGRVEAVDVDIDRVRAEEGAVDLGGCGRE